MNRAWLGVIAIGALSLSAMAGPRSAEAQDADQKIHRHAAIGQTVRLRGHVNYSVCGSVIPTTVTVVQAPQHGTLSVRDEVVKSGDPELGSGGKCRGYSGAGKVVYYTRATAGTDTFEYKSVSGNGTVELDVTVN